MKLSARLRERGLTTLSNVLLCEEVHLLEVYYEDEGSGFERSIGGWLRSILETFPVEKVVSRKPNRDL